MAHGKRYNKTLELFQGQKRWLKTGGEEKPLWVKYNLNWTLKNRQDSCI